MGPTFDSLWLGLQRLSGLEPQRVPDAGSRAGAVSPEVPQETIRGRARRRSGWGELPMAVVLGLPKGRFSVEQSRRGVGGAVPKDRGGARSLDRWLRRVARRCIYPTE